MNVLYLKYAYEIAKTGSISKAAENLFIAQPNLSRALKDLECSLGITIFIRTPKGMTLTPDGEKLLQYCKSPLSQLDNVEDMFKNSKKKGQRFSISVPRASYISDAFARFTKSLNCSSPAEIFYNETDSSRTVDNIIEHNYRLGIVRYAEKYDNYYKKLFEELSLSYEVIADFNFLLIFSKSSPLADKCQVSLSDLKNFIEIAHADPYVPSVSVQYLKKEELPDTIDKRIFVFERGSQFEILSTNPKTFMLVSSVPADLLEKYNLTQTKLDGETKNYRDVLIYKSHYSLTKEDKLFIAELQMSKKVLFD